MKKENLSLFELGIAVDIAARLINEVRKELGFKDMEDFDCYLNQVEMDNKGLGINGKQEQIKERK